MSDYEKPRYTRSERHSSQNQHRRRQAPKKKKKHTGLKVVLTILGIVLLAGVAYAGTTYFKAKNAADQTYDKDNAVNTASTDFDGSKPVSFLLLGTDTGAFGRTEDVISNTDTMIVATLDPKQKKMSLVSIPRDTMAEMVGDKSFNVQKINGAYPIGGAKMSMKSVAALLNVPIKYYIEVNMAGLEKIVDSVGGVDVDVPFDFSYDGHSFTTGNMHLNGAAALAYARMRYDDPEGDYGRQTRQRQVIMSIIKNAISLNTVKNLDTILKSLSNNVKTNLSFDNLVAIATNYRDAADKMKSDYLHGANAYIGEAAYQVMSTAELQRVSNLLRSNMGLESEVIDNNETYQNSQNPNFIWKGATTNQTYTIYSQDNPGVVWNGLN